MTNILVKDTVIIAIFSTYEIVENGYLIEDAVYPDGEIYQVELAAEVIPQKYCYTVEAGVYLNQQWVQSVEQEKKKAVDDFAALLIAKGLVTQEQIDNL